MEGAITRMDVEKQVPFVHAQSQLQRYGDASPVGIAGVQGYGYL